MGAIARGNPETAAAVVQALGIAPEHADAVAEILIRGKGMTLDEFGLGGLAGQLGIARMPPGATSFRCV